MSSNVHDPAAEPTLRELDALIETIAELGQTSLARDEFYRQFLERTVRAMAASGGIVWTRDSSAGLRAACRLGMTDDDGGPDDAPTDWHRISAAWVLANRTARAVPPAKTISPEALSPNPTRWLVLFFPWGVGAEMAGVVEIVQRPHPSASLQIGYLRFLEAACELLADYEKGERTKQAEHRQRRSLQIDEFSRTVHASLDLLPTAYSIASEACRILECDRVSVLVRRGRGCKLVAVSGTDTFSRRANTVRFMERVVGAVLAAGDTLWHPSTDQLPPQIETPLDAYLDESHARGLGILPLRAAARSEAPVEAEVLGALVVERFYGSSDEPLRETATVLVAHSALALQNALALERIPFARTLRGMGAASRALRGRRLAVGGLVLAGIAAVAAALTLVPADFSIEARGELQPLLRREIFAPDDGVVRELRSGSGARVEAGQVLLVLRKPALDLEFKRVWGELQTAAKKLAAVESEQLLNRREDETQRRRYMELTAQQEELRAMISGLDAQHAILRLQQSELEIRSPIAGELLTWDAEQLLAGRPVARGQVLLTVADLAGPWRLELRVPERRMRHLAEAGREVAGALDVSFALATNPGLVLWGELDGVGGRTEMTENDGPVVLATTAIDGGEIADRVPGAGVVARIHCGSRPIGYVWFHDLIDAVRTWILF